MGKSIVVLGANFSENSIGKIKNDVVELFSGNEEIWESIPQISLGNKSAHGIFASVAGKIIGFKCYAQDSGEGTIIVNLGRTSTRKASIDINTQANSKNWIAISQPVSVSEGDFIGICGRSSGSGLPVKFSSSVSTGGKTLTTFKFSDNSYDDNANRAFSFAVAIEVED